MTPSLGLFYSGMVKNNNFNHMIGLSLTLYAIITLLWFVIGFSLAFGKNNYYVFGGFDHIAMLNLDYTPFYIEHTIPSNLFCFFQ